MNDVCKGKLEICANDSFNKLDELINVQGMKKEKAFKKVAEDWNAVHPESSVNWESLKKSYNRAIKPTVKSGTMSRKSTNEKPGHCPEKIVVPLDIPMADDYVLLQEKYKQAQERIEELVQALNDLTPYANRVVELEEELRLLKESCVAPAEILIEQAEVSTLIPRQLVFEFIQKNGTEFQVMALKDESLPNEKLWKVFLKVREQYKASTPPPAWDKIIVNATGIE